MAATSIEADMTRSKPQMDLTIGEGPSVKQLYEAYALSLGKVAHNWNVLFESLGELFSIILGADDRIASAIWYVPDSDRIKANMLKAAALNVASDGDRIPKAERVKSDVVWLVDAVQKLTDLRNDVIHAPCSVVSSGTRTMIEADPFSSHGRAQKIRGKDIFVEFEWCERWSDELVSFARHILMSLRVPEYCWPERPTKPIRMPLDALLEDLFPKPGKT